MILAYMLNFINENVECAPWFKTWGKPIWFCIRKIERIGM